MLVRVKSDASFKSERHTVGLGAQIVANKEAHDFALRVKAGCLKTSVKAEIQACIYALHQVIDNFGVDEFVMYMSDSSSVIHLLTQMLEGDYETDDKQLLHLKKVLAQFKHIEVKWIPRKENKACDRLSKLVRKKIK